jgi:WD40 repeat protein
MLTPNFKIDREFRGHVEDVRSIASQSGSSSYFATASRDKTIRIWNLDHDETSLLEQKVFNGHDSFVTCVHWVPEGFLDFKEEILLSGSRDRRVLVWSIPRGLVLKELNGHAMDITAVIVLKNGDIVTASQDSHICVWRKFKLLKVRGF